MESVQDDLELNKNQRALERKRLADRNSRRLERARTKQHIADLEERIQLLLQREDSSDLVQKLLAQNAQLTELIHSYEKTIASVKGTLSEIPEASISSGEAVPSIGTSTDPIVYLTNQAQDSGTHPSQIPYPASHSGPDNHAHTDSDDHLTSMISLFPDQDLHGLPTFLPTFLGSAGPRTLYMVQHPSPLDKMSIYRLSAGVPSYLVGFNHNYQHDNFSSHAMEDVLQEERITTFFGDRLPILDPTLCRLYAGIRDHLSHLKPVSILNELILGSSSVEHESSSLDVQSSNIIELLKMSIAKHTASAIREAQSSLRPEQRRSLAEIVAVFWILYKLLTWMAFPTADNFEQIPPWHRPTQAQLSISHPNYIDALVFPLLREKLVYTYQTYETTKLLEHLNSLFTIVWQPKMWVISQDTPLIYVSPNNLWEFELEPNFKDAIWDLRSWRMMPEFIALYPELASCVHT